MSRLALAGAVLSVLTLAAALGSPARADDPAYVSLDEVLKKRGAAPAFVVVVAKDDTEMSKTVLKLLADPKLAKPVKDGIVAARIDPADENAAKQLNIAAEKTECVLVFDGYVIPSGKNAKVPNADTLAGLVKKAQDVTKKKKDTEKKLDGAVTKAEAAVKGGDPKSACEQLLSVTALKDTIPCAAIEKAQKDLDELQGKGLALLTKAREAVGKNDFAGSHKLIAEAQNSYPIPAVLEEAKSVSMALAQAERAASGK